MIGCRVWKWRRGSCVLEKRDGLGIWTKDDAWDGGRIDRMDVWDDTDELEGLGLV